MARGRSAIYVQSPLSEGRSTFQIPKSVSYVRTDTTNISKSKTKTKSSATCSASVVARKAVRPKEVVTGMVWEESAVVRPVVCSDSVVVCLMTAVGEAPVEHQSSLERDL